MPTSIWSSDFQETINNAKSKHSKKVIIKKKALNIPSPFPSPEDWRDHWIYFLMLDRFNNPDSPPEYDPWDSPHGVFQGGSFKGVTERLDYLKEMGVGAIWLTPPFKNCQHNIYTYHGYGIQDFLSVDPRFGTEQELQDLIDGAHARGIYVIFDIVLNHAGDVFSYEGNRPSAPWQDQEYTISWRNEQGNPTWIEAPLNCHPDAAVWPQELRDNKYFRRKGMGGEAGGDFESLKELVTRYSEVVDLLIKAYQYSIAKFDIDGFRIDTLKFIEPEFARIFGNAMREFALSIGKKNFFTFGEVWDSEEKIAHYIGSDAMNPDDMIGVDAALDFPLFYNLPWVIKGFLPPSGLSHMFEYRKNVQRGHLSSHGEASRYFVTFLDNHDQHQRFYYSNPSDQHKYDLQMVMGITSLFLLQGIPCLYYGTEQGLHGSGGSDANVREALWGKPSAFDITHHFYQAIQQLSLLRSQHPALRYGRQYFREISGNGIEFGISHTKPGVLAFSRILNDTEVIIVANTNMGSEWNGYVVIDFSLNPIESTYDILYSNLQKQAAIPGKVIEKAGGSVVVHRLNGDTTSGPVRALPVKLNPMEIQVLVKSTST